MKKIETIDNYKDIPKYNFKKDDLFELLFLSTVWCNMKCLFCCEQWKDKNISMEKWFKHIKNIVNKLGVKLIDINWGEPLLRWNEYIFSLIKKIKSELNVAVSISSNITKLDEELLLNISPYIDIFNVSLHWYSNETNDYLMGKSWVTSKIKDNIEKIIDVWIETHVTCVVVNENKEELPQLAEWCDRNGVTSLCMNVMFWRWKWKEFQLNNQPNSEELEKIRETLSKKNPNLNVYVNHSYIWQCILLRPNWDLVGVPSNPKSEDDWQIYIWNALDTDINHKWNNYPHKDWHYRYNKKKFYIYI